MRQKIESNGFEFFVSVDREKLEKQLLGPYKERIKVLESLLEKRDNQIYKYHEIIKHPKNSIIFPLVAEEVIKPIKQHISYKKLFVLQYIYDKGILSADKILKYAKELGIKGVGYVTYVKNMHETGFLEKDKHGYYYISDKGKEVVEYYVKNCYILFKELYNNKPYFKKAHFITYKKKYTEEEIKRRSDAYKKLMKPFWDSGFTFMIKDVNKRIKILSEWMKKNNIQDEYYLRLMMNWSSNSSKKR
jgi:hypothetical protein